MELNYSEFMDKIALNKLGGSEEAGLWVSSLPLPVGFPKELELSNYENLQGMGTYIKELGNWAGKEDGNPRRLLLFADGNNSAPDKIGIVEARNELNDSSIDSIGDYQTPNIDMQLIEKCPDPGFAWERHMTVISWGNKKVGMLMGLKTKDTVHWWEACKLITLKDHANCKEVEIGGAIPLKKYDSTDSKSVGYENPLLHRHNWLNGHIYARLHSNGVCEVYAHHINSKFFDDGLDLKDAVPVIGFRIFDEQDVNNNDIMGTWTGDKGLINMGSIEFDISDACHLATEKSPGSFEYHDDFLVWQPYEGAELYGGAASKAILGDEFIFRAENKLIPRGMSRTVRFSFSLSDRSPRVVRYIAPAWWYGVCEEFLPEPLLPISNEYDKLIEGARKYISKYTVKGGYEDGSVPRNIGTPGEGGRFEPGWEGEMPGGQFLCAYRTSDYEDYDLAIRSAYVFTDVYVDHAVKAVRMHGFPAYGFSVPMNRIHGPLYAYLETGDPYLLQTAKAVIDTSYYTHKNSWPRLAVGRDACFIRGAVLLYRYFNDFHYKEMAKDAIKDTIASQREDGSFGDQGGGTGVHQWAAYIVKPWMGLMAMGGIVDYLELNPGEPEMLSSVKKFGDWLLRERFEHVIKPNNIRAKGWAYQHYFKDDVMFQLGKPKKWVNLKEPDGNLWHVEYLSRFLGYCSITFNDPAYLDAWAESYEAYYGDKPEVKSDHAAVQIFQYIPWLQAKLWNAKLSEDGVSLKPFKFGPRTVKEASVMTPTWKVES